VVANQAMNPVGKYQRGKRNTDAAGQDPVGHDGASHDFQSVALSKVETQHFFNLMGLSVLRM